MKLSIYSIQSTIFSGEVRSVTIPTPLGEITVLKNHLPLVTAANHGFIRYTDSGSQEKIIDFPGGVAEIRPGNEVVILAG